MSRYYGFKCLQCDEEQFIAKHVEGIYESVPLLAKMWDLRQQCKLEIYFSSREFDHLDEKLEWIYNHHQHPLIWIDEYHAVYIDELELLDDERLLQLANLTIAQDIDVSQWNSQTILDRQALVAKDKATEIAQKRAIL